jgi:hypothetical protein
MVFKDDGGGFAFSCEDAKISICASTWGTRLSQLSRVNGPIFIMTGELPDIVFISHIISKRPRDIFIIANSAAEMNAKILKRKFPEVRIVLHPNNNAKVIWYHQIQFGFQAPTSARRLKSNLLWECTLELCLIKRLNPSSRKSG